MPPRTLHANYGGVRASLVNMTNTRNLATVIAFAALLGSGRLVAQERIETGNIPFNFEVGSAHMPAGTYKIVQDRPGMVRMLDVAQSRGVLVSLPIAKQGSGQKASLAFHRYGSRYFLAEIWFADDTTGHAVMPSRTEREFQAATRNSKPASTYVALR